MNVSILHLSDLHRDASSPVTNAVIADSLVIDRGRYVTTDPAIKSPDLIVVTGDLIQGVKDDTADTTTALRAQYDEATDLLSTLTTEFVGGDRERVVLVPGNHDVSFYHSVTSLSKVDLQLTEPGTARIISEYVAQLYRRDSSLRWSWEQLSFFKMVDTDQYADRLAAFADCYERFYEGKRSYPLNPTEQYDIFDFSDLGVTIVGFNSCHNNDPLNRTGSIHPDCIVNAASTLRHPMYRNRLLIAAWHHSIGGGPLQSDYMDGTILQFLIERGYSIGMHGHQHRTEYITEYFKFGVNRRMTVISAGTLCGGSSSIPTGHQRSYNVLDIDTAEWRATLHQRRMRNDELGTPIWGTGSPLPDGTSSVQFDVEQPLEQPQPLAVRVGLEEAEKAVGEKRFEDGMLLLEPIAGGDDLARRLLLECYVELGLWERIALEFYPPQSAIEIVYVAESLVRLGDGERLKELCNSEVAAGSADPAVKQVVEKYRNGI